MVKLPHTQLTPFFHELQQQARFFFFIPNFAKGQTFPCLGSDLLPGGVNEVCGVEEMKGIGNVTH